MTDESRRRPGHVYDPEDPLPEHLRPPPEKPFRYKVKDTDSVNVAHRIQTLGHAGWLGILGMFVGMAVALQTGGNIILYVLIGLASGTAIAAFIGLKVAGGAGRMASTVYMPSGSSTPPVRQYSLADSYITRGRYDAAVQELQQAARQYPRDPEPRLRLARLFRDRLGDADQALHWFRETLAVPDIEPHVEIGAARELIEVYTHRLKIPARALPELARLASRHPGTAAGEWAARELKAIKAALHAQEEHD